MVCWMDDRPLAPAAATSCARRRARRPRASRPCVYRVDVDTLQRAPAATLGLNDIGRVRVEAASPLYFDAYRDNTATGAFILVDADTNATVAAGMVRGGAAMIGEADAGRRRRADGRRSRPTSSATRPA